MPSSDHERGAGPRPPASHRLRNLKSIMSTIQVKPYSTTIGSRPRWPVGAVLGFAFCRITSVVALWRSRVAARRQLRVLRYMDDRLLADIGLTRIDLSSRRETSFFGGEGFIASHGLPPSQPRPGDLR